MVPLNVVQCTTEFITNENVKSADILMRLRAQFSLRDPGV
jgi:hypothetical protein